jgi:alpha-glucosidase
VHRDSLDETWEQPWGEERFIRNHYNELALDVESAAGLRMTIRFRAFDDGIGFRYEWPEQVGLASFELMDELTEITLAGDPSSWWIPAYWWNRYEYLYRNSPASRIDTVHTPVTFETEDGLFIALHEAALVDFPSMTLARTAADSISVTLKADLVPWSDGVLARGDTPHQSSWRTIRVADSAGDLLTSYIDLNLNEPNVLGDDVAEWARPGKYLGVWWEIHIGRSTWHQGEDLGATTENVKRYIDFAAEHGFDHVLVEGWNIGWDENWFESGDVFDFTTPVPAFDIEELSRYAAERGVRIMGHHETSAGVINYERQMGDAYDWANRYGISAIKTGYVGHGQNIIRLDEHGDEHREWHHGQHMVRHYQKSVEEAAKRRIGLNVHEPIKDTGLRRTWPNLMTREGARGQEYNAWGEHGGNPPDHVAILPFTRMLSGPFDYTPAIFGIDIPERDENRINSTLAQQLAHMVILYSPLQMAADTPDNYERHMDAFQFIKDVPADWETTRVLHSSIGNYVTIVRKERGGTDWYLGSLTDDHGRILTTPLTFLDEGVTYVAEIYRDGEDADWVTNPLDYVIEQRLVTSGMDYELRLAPGGGQAIRFRPGTDDDLASIPHYTRQ